MTGNVVDEIRKLGFSVQARQGKGYYISSTGMTSCFSSFLVGLQGEAVHLRVARDTSRETWGQLLTALKPLVGYDGLQGLRQSLWALKGFSYDT